MVIDSLRVIRALRLIIALVVGTFLSNLLTIPMSGWIMVTSAVVLFDQDTVGGTINRGRMRLLATVYAAAISLTSIWLFAKHPYIIWAITLISVFCYAYYYMGTKNSYIGVLGVVTLAILLVANQHLQMITAIYRVCDIFIGVILALLAMSLIYPQYAYKKAQVLLDQSLNDMINLLQSVTQLNSVTSIHQQILQLETQFLSEVVAFNKNLEEASYELSNFNAPQLLELYSASILLVRRLYRLLIIIFYYELEAEHLSDTIFRQINQQIIEFLTAVVLQQEWDTNYSNLVKLNQQLSYSSLQRSVSFLLTEIKALATNYRTIHQIKMNKIKAKG